MDYSRNLKILRQPVALFYFVAVLLVNCRTCLYGNQTSEYFRLVPPVLGDYLDSLEQAAWLFCAEQNTRIAQRRRRERSDDQRRYIRRSSSSLVRCCCFCSWLSRLISSRRASISLRLVFDAKYCAMAWKASSSSLDGWHASTTRSRRCRFPARSIGRRRDSARGSSFSLSLSSFSDGEQSVEGS
jgi:hypothetical protein